MNKALRGKIGTYIGVVLIIVWGLAPCYWMIVTALRDPADTFSTSLWPTNLTLSKPYTDDKPGKIAYALAYKATL